MYIRQWYPPILHTRDGRKAVCWWWDRRRNFAYFCVAMDEQENMTFFMCNRYGRCNWDYEKPEDIMEWAEEEDYDK